MNYNHIARGVSCCVDIVHVNRSMFNDKMENELEDLDEE